jgi:hypothetical protein
MAWRTLSTFDAVIGELGGIKQVAELAGVTSGAVCHWRTRGGRFPAKLMERIQAELMVRGAIAPRCLWDFDPPKTYLDDDEPKRAVKRA